MKRKYIDEIGLKLEDTPQGWCKNDPRKLKWEKQREEWGFDERETWDLTYSFMLWLFERLSVYNEINIVDTSFNKYKYKGKTLTFQDCIDKMIAGSLLYLTKEAWDWTDEDMEEFNDTIELFALCFWQLWW